MTTSLRSPTRPLRHSAQAVPKWQPPAPTCRTRTCVASSNSIRGLYDFFEAKAQLTTIAPLYIGEVGRYYGCRFVEETNFLSNTDGSSGLYGEAAFFGADAVREGVAIPEEIRVGIPTDFGRDQAIAWYALLGFQ